MSYERGAERLVATRRVRRERGERREKKED
jgi:hypothetical protein